MSCFFFFFFFFFALANTSDFGTIKRRDSDCDIKNISVDLRNIETPSKHLKAGLHQLASETPFKWRFAGETMVARHCMLTVSILGDT